MKRAVTWAALVLTGLAAGCGGSAPAPPRPGPLRSARPQPRPEPPRPRVIRGPLGIEIVEREPVVLACLEVEGIPYAEMGVPIARVARLLDEQGIRPVGFSRTTYLDDPRAVDATRYRYRVGFPVEEKALPRQPLKRLVLPRRLIARVTHRGDFDEAYQVRFYEEIPAALTRMGHPVDGPITEIYCFPVVEDDPHSWVTEVQYPVARQKKTPAKRPRPPAPTPRPTGGRARP